MALSDFQKKEARKILSLSKYQPKHIALILGVTKEEIHDFMFKDRMASKISRSLARFHDMEKAANNLKPPDHILEGDIPRLIFDQYFATRAQLDLYMALLGSQALEQEDKIDQPRPTEAES